MAENASVKQVAQTSDPRIQNAQVRFNQKSAGRLTNAQIAEKTAFNKNTEAANDPYFNNTQDTSGYRGRGSQESKNRTSAREHDQILTILRDVSREFSVPYNTEDAKAVLTDAPQKPDFPYIIFTLAVIKDMLDVPANLSLVGIPLAMVTAFVISIVLFIWMLGKMSGGWWKKKIINWLLVRYVITIAIELLPVGSLIPATTILVLMAHHREMKIVKMFNAALEQLHNKKIPGL